MEMNYERNIENMIDDFVKEAIRNSKTYGEAKEYVSKRVSHNELGSVIKKIAHDKIEHLATRCQNEQISRRIAENERHLDDRKRIERRIFIEDNFDVISRVIDALSASS